VSLKHEIEEQLHIPVRLRMGGPGSFDVFADAERIYSKKQTGRMPASEEIIQLIRNRK
jgi:selT/selW/selH-like putative selenoprotein